MDRERRRRPSESVKSTSQSRASTASTSKSNSTLGDLTAAVRRTTGDVPPPLVGSSSTLVGSEVYVFGGRLVPTRTMIANLWVLNLKTLVWTRLWPKPKPKRESDINGEFFDESGNEDTENSDKETEDGPKPRYFHSAEAWGTDKIVIFGGMSYADERAVEENEDSKKSSNSPGLQVLNDIAIYHIREQRWTIPQCSVDPITIMPSARYAHLSVLTSILSPTHPKPLPRSSMTTLVDDETPVDTSQLNSQTTFQNCLVIMGGQDITNRYIHEMNVLDLNTMTWVQSMRWDRHCGAYRCVAVSAHVSISTSREEDEFGRPLDAPKTNGVTSGTDGEEDDDYKIVNDTLPHSILPTTTRPEPIFLYSNYNFSDVRREFELITTPLPPKFKPQVFQLSHRMVGNPALPPGLRFPTGAILGHYFIIAGTFLSHHFNSYAIWALDLSKMTKEDKENGGGEAATSTFAWQKVDPGGVLQNGSWNRSVFWRNSVVILGDRERDISLDYDRRQSNFTHVAFIDLEAFGIYQPPFQALPPVAQKFGLRTLKEPFLTDFEIVCCDGKTIACSRSVLEDRWEWFRERMEEFRRRAGNIVSAQQRRVIMDDAETIDTTNSKETVLGGMTPIGEWRLLARSLHLPEPSSVVTALLQYFYSLSLCTKLQLSLPVLGSLLIFSRVYGEKTLRKHVVHALHTKLGQSDNVTGVVYQVATLGSCMSLQIRALKMVYNAQKHVRARPRAGTVGEEYKERDPSTSATYRSRAATVGEGVGEGGRVNITIDTSVTGAKPSQVGSESIQSSTSATRPRSKSLVQNSTQSRASPQIASPASTSAALFKQREITGSPSSTIARTPNNASPAMQPGSLESSWVHIPGRQELTVVTEEETVPGNDEVTRMSAESAVSTGSNITVATTLGSKVSNSFSIELGDRPESMSSGRLSPSSPDEQRSKFASRSTPNINDSTFDYRITPSAGLSTPSLTKIRLEGKLRKNSMDTERIEKERAKAKAKEALKEEKARKKKAKEEAKAKERSKEAWVAAPLSPTFISHQL